MELIGGVLQFLSFCVVYPRSGCASSILFVVAFGVMVATCDNTLLCIAAVTIVAGPGIFAVTRLHRWEHQQRATRLQERHIADQPGSSGCA